MRIQLLSTLPLGAAVLGTWLGSGACSAPGSAPSIEWRPQLVFPKAVLPNVRRVVLTVFNASDGIRCDEVTGRAAGIGGSTRAIAQATFGTTGCPNGARYCATVDIPQASGDRVFLAMAYGETNSEIASGCTQAKADRNPLLLEIAMVQVESLPVCGDGVLQPPETCDPSGGDSDPACDIQCQTREVYLSGGSAAAGTTEGRPGDKTRPTLVWPLGAGGAAPFFAVFADRAAPNQELSLRVLDDGFRPFRDLGSVVESSSFFLPNNPGGGPLGRSEPNNQSQPSAAVVGNLVFVAFQDDNAAQGVDIHLRSFDLRLGARENVGQPLPLNGTATPPAGEAGFQGFPSLAKGPGDQLLIAWQDDARGRIAGRVIQGASSSLGPQQEWSEGSGNRSPSVAALPDGWVVAWQHDSDIHMRRLRPDGTALGGILKVNDPSRRGPHEQPSVAALSDGRWAVVWTDRGAPQGGNIYGQRFSASGAAMAADQAEPLGDTSTNTKRESPRIAPIDDSPGSFIVVWLDASYGHVFGRFLGGSSGFLQNADGTAGEYQISRVDSHVRAHPTVVVGGSGPYIGTAWEDLGPDGRPGIYGRRLPLPPKP